MDLPRTIEVRKDGDAWWTEVGGRELRLSNLDKSYWPDEGYTKGDLVNYYANVAELIVPHLASRPLTMKRMPDGVDGDVLLREDRALAHARLDRAVPRAVARTPRRA